MEDGYVRVFSSDSLKCLASVRVYGDVTGLDWVDGEHLLVSVAF